MGKIYGSNGYKSWKQNILYVNFHLKDGLGLKFIAYERKITKGALTSFTLYDPLIAVLTSHIRSHIDI